MSNKECSLPVFHSVQSILPIVGISSSIKYYIVPFVHFTSSAEIESAFLSSGNFTSFDFNNLRLGLSLDELIT